MSILQTGRLQAPQGVKWLAQSRTGPERQDSSLGLLIPPTLCALPAARSAPPNPPRSPAFWASLRLFFPDPFWTPQTPRLQTETTASTLAGGEVLPQPVCARVCVCTRVRVVEALRAVKSWGCV